MIVDGFAPEIDRLAIEKIAGRIVYDSLEKSKFVFDSKVQNDLSKSIQRAALQSSVKYLVKKINYNYLQTILFIKFLRTTFFKI
jgi:hypothetical protein